MSAADTLVWAVKQEPVPTCAQSLILSSHPSRIQKLRQLPADSVPCALLTRLPRQRQLHRRLPRFSAVQTFSCCSRADPWLACQERPMITAASGTTAGNVHIMGPYSCHRITCYVLRGLKNVVSLGLEGVPSSWNISLSCVKE